MADSAPKLVRDSTMNVTAKEGVEFLKSQGAHDLLPEDPDKPGIQRDTTIQTTVKDSEAILKDANIDKDGRTRGDQQRLQEISQESDVAEPPRVPRDHTMKETAKEAQELLGDAPIGETRSQTRNITKAAEEEDEEEDDDEEDDDEEEEDDGVEDGEGDEDVASLKRTHTMAETLQEGQEFLKRQKTNGDVAEKNAAEEA